MGTCVSESTSRSLVQLSSCFTHPGLILLAIGRFALANYQLSFECCAKHRQLAHEFPIWHRHFLIEMLGLEPAWTGTLSLVGGWISLRNPAPFAAQATGRDKDHFNKHSCHLRIWHCVLRSKKRAYFEDADTFVRLTNCNRYKRWPGQETGVALAAQRRRWCSCRDRLLGAKRSPISLCRLVPPMKSGAASEPALLIVNWTMLVQLSG